MLIELNAGSSAERNATNGEDETDCTQGKLLRWAWVNIKAQCFRSSSYCTQSTGGKAPRKALTLDQLEGGASGGNEPTFSNRPLGGRSHLVNDAIHSTEAHRALLAFFRPFLTLGSNGSSQAAHGGGCERGPAASSKLAAGWRDAHITEAVRYHVLLCARPYEYR